MRGYHEVKEFPWGAVNGTMSLPIGWKPFSAYYAGGILMIVARKWHRAD